MERRREKERGGEKRLEEERRVAKKREEERNKLNEDERALRREQRARNQKKGNFTEMIRKITHAIGGYPRFTVRVDPVSIVRTTNTHTHKQKTANAIIPE